MNQVIFYDRGDVYFPILSTILSGGSQRHSRTVRAFLVCVARLMVIAQYRKAKYVVSKPNS